MLDSDNAPILPKETSIILTSQNSQNTGVGTESTVRTTGGKKLYTREEFEQIRLEAAASMAENKDLQKDALGVFAKADEHLWIHQTTWFGEPVLQLPQDLMAVQEIIFRTKPKFIIEVGTAWAGSLLFYSTLMEVLGGERIVGIDVYIPKDLKDRITSFERLSQRISWISGSSTDPSTVEEVQSIVGGSKEVMVVLDSDHTHDHVLNELNLYSPLVGVGQYLVVSDTIVEYIPQQTHRPRPWGPGNNPKTALDDFLGQNDTFEVDAALGNKLLFTCQPGGYLKRVK